MSEVKCGFCGHWSQCRECGYCGCEDSKRMALLEADAKKHGEIELGFMKTSLEYKRRIALLEAENQRLRRALQHVQFYALDNVPDELREMAKAVLQEDKR